MEDQRHNPVMPGLRIFNSLGATQFEMQHEQHTDGCTDPRAQRLSTRELRRAEQRALKRLAKKEGRPR